MAIGAHFVDTGVLGVRLFFVLSGFLIGSILLRERERNGSSLQEKLRKFYARRFLRLSPPYLVYLAAAFFLYPNDRGYLPWFLLYLQNFLFALHPEVFSHYLAHFWTLAIEEQFYLVVPFVLLRLARAHIVPLMIGLIIAAPVFRAAMLGFGYNQCGNVGAWPDGYVVHGGPFSLRIGTTSRNAPCGSSRWVSTWDCRLPSLLSRRGNSSSLTTSSSFLKTASFRCFSCG